MNSQMKHKRNVLGKDVNSNNNLYSSFSHENEKYLNYGKQRNHRPNKQFVNYIKSKISHKEKLYAKREIAKHIKRIKIIESNNWLKPVSPKVSVPILQVSFTENVKAECLI